MREKEEKKKRKEKTRRKKRNNNNNKNDVDIATLTDSTHNTYGAHLIADVTGFGGAGFAHATERESPVHGLSPLLHSRVHVDVSELEEGGKDEEEANGHPDVQGFDVGYAREVGAGAGALGCHGQH